MAVLKQAELGMAVPEIIRNVIRDRYADFGPTLACEKLREKMG